MVDIKPAKTFGKQVKRRMSEIFVNGFYADLKSISKSKEILVRAFKHMFVLKSFYVATIDNEVVGMAACTRKDMPVVRLNKDAMIKYFRPVKGTLITFTLPLILKRLKKDAEKMTELPSKERLGFIEFVSTDEGHRGKGVGTELIKHLLSLHEFDRYVLEVNCENESAVRLYSSLGFKEIKKLGGKHKRMYMYYEK